ncbi:MAG TPA: hypothetical protein VGS22_16230 [Thermoanaerobaculia bacterium]|jgi:hypothetical protein|nr:hypothetical protein [Thermoanaerobaculia bacterium]
MKKALISLSVLCVLVAPMVGCAKKEEPAETAVETTSETTGTEMTSEAPMSTEMTSDAAPLTTGQ